MFRRILLSMLATATLAGCATAYTYRGGNGDYYYGQPQTEYRYHDPYGFYGGFGYGGYAPGVYYDRYGRVIYGSYYGYFGYPPGYGSPWWYRPRAPHDGHDHGGDGHDGDGHGGEDGDGSDRRPPWRNPGGLWWLAILGVPLVLALVGALTGQQFAPATAATATPAARACS